MNYYASIPIFTTRKRSCGKVMFSEAFVCPRGGSLSSGGSLHGDPPSYGGSAGGTHPTGMHFCYRFHWKYSFQFLLTPVQIPLSVQMFTGIVCPYWKTWTYYLKNIQIFTIISSSENWVTLISKILIQLDSPQQYAHFKRLNKELETKSANFHHWVVLRTE